MAKKAYELYKKSLETIEFYKVLDILSSYCISDEAKHMAGAILPYRRVQDVEKSLKKSDEARTMLDRRGTPEFGKIYDIRPSVKRAKVGSALSMGELLKIGGLLKTSRNLLAYYDAFEGDYILGGHFSNLESITPLERRIYDSIISQDEMSDSASGELYDIRRKILRLNSKIKDTMQSMIHSAKYQKYLQEPIITVRNERFVVPVKAEYRSEVGGLVHDMSATGATLFIEPMAVVDANNKIKILYAEEKEEIERILYDISREVASHDEAIERNFHHIVQLDFAFAKAHLARVWDARAPVICNRPMMQLNGARHPLIEKDKVVPIDIELGKRFDTLVITGPNTGGKTVALKTAGLLCAMALSGLLIPVGENSEVGMFEYIFADVGDEQSIEQSLSTFSSHMVNIVNIIEQANDKTMALFDEIGAGTDPIEGAALAIAILEYARSLGTKIAATTHYSELKIYALSTDGVENGSCEFDAETLKPTYKLLIGVPGRSQAFAISKRLGLSDYIIASAKKRIGQESIAFEDVLRDLEKNRLETERERERANSLVAEVESLKRRMEQSEMQHKKEREALLTSAKEEAQRILTRARETSDKVLGELDKLKKEEVRNLVDINLMKSRTVLRGEIKSAETDIDMSRRKPAQKSNITRPLVPGDLVRIINLNKEAVVLEEQDGDKVLLKAGIMKVTINIDELELIEGAKSKRSAKKAAKAQGSIRRGVDIVNRAVTTEIDVRGFSVEEAVYDIDKIIDEAVLLNQKTIQIIHGKGTGALRAGIHAYLRGHRNVESFRLGRYGEGEMGVTIIELK